MKRFKLIAAPLLLLAIVGCNNNDKTTSDNDVDAARNFIQSALNGDFDRAKTFMVNDSLNNQDLDNVVRLSERLSPEEKQKFKEASIRIHGVRPINDSTSMIVFSNSYKNKQDSLKVIRINNQWLVDFKYIFRHATDSLMQQ